MGRSIVAIEPEVEEAEGAGAHLDLRQKGEVSTSMHLNQTQNSTVTLIEIPNMMYCWHRRVIEADTVQDFRSMPDPGQCSSLEVIAKQGRKRRGLQSNHLVEGKEAHRRESMLSMGILSLYVR